MIFNDKQIAYLRSLGFNYTFDKAFSEEEYFAIYDKVADILQFRGFDEYYEPTEEGLMCESILDIMADI